MSTLVAQTISNGTVSTSTANVINGAKAWVNFNGTTASPSTIRGSYNVTSVTKNGTGDYTVNFTTAMPNANFASVLTQGNTDGTNPSGTNSIGVRSATTTTCQIGCRTSAGAQYDAPVVNVAIFSS